MSESGREGRRKALGEGRGEWGREGENEGDSEGENDEVEGENVRSLETTLYHLLLLYHLWYTYVQTTCLFTHNI